MGDYVKIRSRFLVLASVAAAIVALSSAPAGARNVILFVPDGLRSLSVDAANAPTMDALRKTGVYFANSHSLFPTFTTANASAMATGHYLGDTGDFSNTVFVSGAISGTVTPFLENDAVLGAMDAEFGGDYLDETTILRAANLAGYSTAAVGKLGPTLIFDHTARSGAETIVVDDSTGTPQGIPLAADYSAAAVKAGIALATPKRDQDAGTSTTPGAKRANYAQIRYFADTVASVILPLFKQRGKPFVIVFWPRDPDGTQHVQGDSLNALVPGINGPTSLAAVRNADDALARVRTALDTLGLAGDTDIVVSADHGFSTVWKESNSPAARQTYTGVVPGLLPPGFLAIDLARGLGLPLADPDKGNAPVSAGSFPFQGNGVIGNDPAEPEVVVAANGGSDLVYLPNGDANANARRVVDTLLTLDYVSGIFVADRLGSIDGTLPLSLINLDGAAVTPHPAIVVNFTSKSTGCAVPVMCVAEISDTRYQQGQGMHGNFNRGDTFNFQAALGPDFKRGFVDDAPTSNADVGITLARLLHLSVRAKGAQVGRSLDEAMVGGTEPAYTTRSIVSRPGANQLRTSLRLQEVRGTRYFDVAGFPGRTVGL